jgi:SAM-dependent methyltransferase
MLQQKDMLRSGISILHFSPSRILQKKIRQLVPAGYITTDYDQDALTDRHYDITHVPMPEGSFELIICFHILEHIPDDRKAISELYRISKTGGVVLIQTPFQQGEIYEDKTVTGSAERLRHFGQEDHVRIYSAEGLSKRLQEGGFMVDVNQYAADSGLGLRDEIILVCKKTT